MTNTIKRLAGNFSDLDTRKANASEVIPLTQKAAAGGVATLDANGLVPLDQLDLDALDEVETVTSITDTAPASATEGDIYYNSGDNALYTYTSGAWVAGPALSKKMFYVDEANSKWYKWVGTAMVALPELDENSAVNGIAFAAGDAWTENAEDGTYSLALTVDTEGNPYAVVGVADGGGATVFVDTAISTGATTVLTITSAAAFTGTAYVSSVV